MINLGRAVTGPGDTDRCADLAVGAPGEGAVCLLRGSPDGVSSSGVPRRDVSGRRDAGAVVVLRQLDGALGRQVLTQNTRGVAGAFESGDSFGGRSRRAPS